MPPTLDASCPKKAQQLLRWDKEFSFLEGLISGINLTVDSIKGIHIYYVCMHGSHEKYETQRRARWLKLRHPLYRGEASGGCRQFWRKIKRFLGKWMGLKNRQQPETKPAWALGVISTPVFLPGICINFPWLTRYLGKRFTQLNIFWRIWPLSR